MRIQSKYRGIKGFVTVYNRAVRYTYMITAVAKRRLKIFEHWKKHDLPSAIDAFDISERTLWYWKGRLDAGSGQPEALNPSKRTPKRIWDYRILEELRSLRDKDNHLNLGAEKLYPLLLDFCNGLGIKCPKPTTIERLIADMGGLRTSPQKVSRFGQVKRVKRKKVLRKLKDPVPLYPGHIMATSVQ